MEMPLNRNTAVATVMYMQKAVGVIPTTGTEWDGVRAVMDLVEKVANGQVTVEVHPVEAQKTNGIDRSVPEPLRAELR